LKATARRTVLVIDDEEQVRNVVKRYLTEAGFDVRTAADGRQALEMVQSQSQPDAIVLDLLMPVMSGFEVLSALRIIPAWATIPVVVLSASTDYSAEHLGAAVLLQKPFIGASLTAAVEAALASKRTARS
jgi:CheY-like chemotaxis protein